MTPPETDASNHISEREIFLSIRGHLPIQPPQTSHTTIFVAQKWL